MPLVSQLIFEIVKWRARRGLTRVAQTFADGKAESRQTGVRGETLAFVEARTRTAREDQAALPELSVTAEKQQVVARTPRRFVMERHVKECPMRFDVEAIEEFEGRPPTVRLHKAAFCPQM